MVKNVGEYDKKVDRRAADIVIAYEDYWDNSALPFSRRQQVTGRRAKTGAAHNTKNEPYIVRFRFVKKENWIYRHPWPCAGDGDTSTTQIENFMHELRKILCLSTERRSGVGLANSGKTDKQRICP